MPLGGAAVHAGTASRLSELLADVEDPDRLAEAGEWIVDCATGTELLARADLH